MTMKLAVASSTSIIECMSANRFVDYDESDFERVKYVSQIEKKFCSRIFRCKISSCNIKRALKDNKDLVISNLRKIKRLELEQEVNDLDRTINSIIEGEEDALDY